MWSNASIQFAVYITYTYRISFLLLFAGPRLASNAMDMKL